jgi:nicotinamidase/pyrazinamidase
MTAALKPGADDALIVVDVQNDFCAGGSLAAPDGEGVVPVINRLAPAFAHVIATQDWHPAGHQSFASSHPGKQPFETVRVSYGEQTLWPDHCVQDTPGAAFHQHLDLAGAQLILRKGCRREIDSYSAFFENDRTTATGLSGYLRTRGVSRLFVAGLVTDFCVCYSAIDGRNEGFEVVVIEDACRAIDQDGSLDAAWIAMQEAGVRRIDATVFDG